MKHSLGIYIPLYNEEEGISQLKKELNKLEELLVNNCDYDVNFVDDGSTDATLELLIKNFTGKQYNIIKHTENKNLGGFLKTSIDNCKKEYIAFLDSDCTYSPSLISEMFDKAISGISIVSASPYHPEGSVVGVGPIRLKLSKSVNLIYRYISGRDIYTTSSICKMYKMAIVRDIKITRKNFVAVTELFTKSILLTDKILDLPCVLSTRLYGESKLDIYSNIYDHVKYIIHYIKYKYER